MELPERKNYEKFSVDEETGEVVKIHDERGAEMPDPVPMAPPLGYSKPLSMFDQMRAQIRAEHVRLRQLELEELVETREQANDFDVDEDIENQPSLYEEKFDPVEFEARSRLRQQEFAASVDKRVNELAPKPQELLDGSSLEQSDADGRREADRKTGVRRSSSKLQDDRKSREVASDRGDVSEGDSEDR